ncbi:MAG TPA: hypothetical protein VLK82_17095, partial [Candidatus Tectomicrobia bacterium]|nr:hypothetical protein [Candidatus Tectomicrobia bacterium]
LLQEVAGQPEDLLRRGLPHLQAAEFVYDMGVFPDVQYAFTHTLTHEVAYDSLLQERRRALHARIIEAIEAAYVDRLPEWADRLAYHVVRGEVWSKALTYFRQNPAVAPPVIDASLWWMGQHDRAVQSNQRDLSAAAEFKDFAGQVVANFRLGQAYHALGVYPHAIDVLGQNVTALEGELLRERFDMPGLASVLSRGWLVWCLAEQGRFGEGLTYGEEAVHIAEQVNDRYSLVVACLGLGMLHLHKGEPQKAITVLERGVTLSEAERLPQLFPLVAAPLGAAYSLDGRVAESVPLLEEAVNRAAALNFMGIQSRRVAWLAEAYLLAGCRDDAMALATRALDLSRAHKERGHEAWSLRLLGEIQAQREPPAIELAEASYRQAVAMAEELGMAPLLAHSLLGLGMLYARSGRPQQARADLSAAVDLFRAMDMRRWLLQAEAMLTQALAY